MQNVQRRRKSRHKAFRVLYLYVYFSELNSSPRLMLIQNKTFFSLAYQSKQWSQDLPRGLKPERPLDLKKVCVYDMTRDGLASRIHSTSSIRAEFSSRSRRWSALEGVGGVQSRVNILDGKEVMVVQMVHNPVRISSFETLPIAHTHLKTKTS